MEPASNHHQRDHHQHDRQNDHQQQQQQQLSLASKELSNIIKGKRTKRVRPQSPIPFSITANSSTGEGGGGTGEGEGEREDCYNGDDVINTNNININIIHNNNNTSPTTSYVEEKQESVMDDEEHDMANCLILLAQGQSKESPKTTDELDGGMMNYTKYSSRKFMEAATLDSGRAGFYVYECKTCNRTFPSFQALGGHRASHKKPKALAIAQERKQFFDDDQEFQFKPNHKPIPLQLNNNGKGNLYGGNNNKSKVHECSICGSEFTSGQALGGHMRRHRAPVGSSTANTTLSLTPMALEPDEDHQPRKKRNVLSLDLDLNLPAPEDDQKESKFAFASKQQHQQQHGQKQHQQQQQQQQQQPQQQTNLVFSAPALVDCHY